MGKNFSHLSWNDRLTISRMLDLGYSVKAICEVVGVHNTTVYRERKRCTYMKRNSDYTETEVYNPDGAEKAYQKKLRLKGPNLKIGNDMEYAEYLEKKVKENFSPAAALACVELENRKFKTKICKTTFYNYIYGRVLNLTEKDLPQKGRKKIKRGHERKAVAKVSAGTSIEKRPQEIKNREEFGNWEMDTVKGKQGKSKCNLLVLTERKTRAEVIRKMPDGKSISVVKELDNLEQELGKYFKNIFKTITVDNGVEFSDPENMQNSVLEKNGGQRTKCFFCHPYSSYERGSNENGNKLIRRWIPKGTDFDDKREDEIRKIQGWMNDYPRRLLFYQTSGQLFLKELLDVGVDVDVGIKLLNIKYTNI